MKFLVQQKQNLTAGACRWNGPNTQRTVSEELFETEETALARYNSMKNSMRFFGAAGQYVTYPIEVEDTYKIAPYRCEWCDTGFDHERAESVGLDWPYGDCCSRACADESRANESDPEETYWEDEY